MTPYEEDGGNGSMTLTHPFGQRTMIRRPQQTPEGGHIFLPPEEQAPQTMPQSPDYSGLGSPEGYTPTPKPQQLATAQPTPASPTQTPQSGAPTPTPQPSSPVAAPATPPPAPTPVAAPKPTAMDEYNRIRASGNSVPASVNTAAAQENMLREQAARTGIDPVAQNAREQAEARQRAEVARLQTERDTLSDSRDAASQARQAFAFATPKYGPSSDRGALEDQLANPENAAAAARYRELTGAETGAQGALDRNVAAGRAAETPQAGGGGPSQFGPGYDALPENIKALINVRTDPSGSAPIAGNGPSNPSGPTPFDGRTPNPQSEVLRNLLTSLQGEAGPTMTPQGGAPLVNMQNAPGGAAPLTGNERPGAIEPPQGAASGLEGSLEAEAQRQLQNPSVYDDQLFKDALQQAGASVNDWYGGAKEELDADLANRGIDFSTIAGTRQAGLLNDRTRQMRDITLPLLRERATSIGGARSAAFNNARGILGDIEDRGYRSRGEARGERGYRDDLRREGRRNAIEEYQIGEDQSRYEDDRIQRLIDRMLSVGYGGAGQGAAGAAGDIYQGAGRQYGAGARDTEDELGQLIEQILSGAYNN